jgi:AraC-like DNA-binding protein
MMPIIVLPLSGGGSRWYRCGATTREIQTTPPNFLVYGKTYERDFGRWKGTAGESITLRFPDTVLQRYLKEDASNFDLDTSYYNEDNILSTTVISLAEEMQSGFPNGRLYAEGLSISVVGWLARHYGKTRPRSVSSKRGLSPQQVVRVRELIESHIGSELTIERMAAELNISPHHFGRLFRMSFSKSPHQYVMSERINRAKNLLHNQSSRQIVDIALQLGFSSQAHFSFAFKKFCGKTPTSWRNEMC